MIIRLTLFFCILSANTSIGQVHIHAHAHNDYEHTHPLLDALQNGFLSVEADVHLFKDQLLVGHNSVDANSPSLEKIYLNPLDSLLKRNDGHVYPKIDKPFFLMIDIKTDAEKTFRALKDLLNKYDFLKHNIVIFLSGNRAINTIIKEADSGIAMDGRPEDIGKGFSNELMPVISDTYYNWSKWDGKQLPQPNELSRIKELAQRVHAEGKKLRLWAIPDNELAWQALLDAGLDLINTDHLEELHSFLTKKGM